MPPACSTDVRTWLAEDWRVVLVTEGHGPAQRLAETCAARGSAPGCRTSTRRRSRACLRHHGLCRDGFVWPAVKLALITESDLAGHPAGLPTTRQMPHAEAGGAAGARTAAVAGAGRTWFTTGTRSAWTWRPCSGPRPARPGHTWSSSTRPARAAAAGPARRADLPARRGDEVLAARNCACIGWAGWTGSRPRAGAKGCSADRSS